MSVILTQLDLKIISERLLNGEVGVVPTDTVYGLVCRADKDGVQELLSSLKGRESKPGTVIASSVGQLLAFGAQEEQINRLDNIWPNPISVVLPFYDKSTLAPNGGDIACRIPAVDWLQEVLKITGPLLTTSANLTGRSPAINLGEAREYFGDNPDFYVDGGIMKNPPSTIVRFEGQGIKILREGSISLETINNLVRRSH